MTNETYDPRTKQTTANGPPNGTLPPAQPSAALARVEEPQEIVRLSMDTVQGFMALQRAAKLLCASNLVPKRYQGAENLPNAVIALEMATRIGASPLMVMQHLYVVHGTPGWSGQFLIATANASGRFTALRYEENGKPGDEYGVRAWAKEQSTGEILKGPWVTWKMVKGEGWLQKDGSKWKTMSGLMFMYRSGAYWVRTYAPELAMGIRTVEEIEDIGPIIDVTPEVAAAAPGSRGAASPEPQGGEPEPEPDAPASPASAAAEPDPVPGFEPIDIHPPDPESTPAAKAAPTVDKPTEQPKAPGAAGLRDRLKGQGAKPHAAIDFDR